MSIPSLCCSVSWINLKGPCFLFEEASSHHLGNSPEGGGVGEGVLSHCKSFGPVAIPANVSPSRLPSIALKQHVGSSSWPLNARFPSMPSLEAWYTYTPAPGTRLPNLCWPLVSGPALLGCSL